MSINKAWIYLIIGGLLEIVWATGFKFEEVPKGLVIISLLLSFYLLIKSVKQLPVGTAYAVFTSMGTIGTVIAESVLSQQSFSIAKTGLILLILFCVIGLKITSEEGVK